MEDRREIGIARENHELLEASRVFEKITDVACDLDVGAVLELRGERLAVDDLDARDHEIGAHGGKGVRIVRAAPAYELAAGIAVAARDRESAARRLRMSFVTH